VGFTWARQYGARIVKDFGKKAAIGFALESPETLNVSGGGLSSTTGPGVVYQVAGSPAGCSTIKPITASTTFPT
jgi:hypothetical protein